MTKIPETEHGGIDWATLEHRQKRQGADITPIETRKAGVKAARVAQHPLDRLRARKSITPRQWEAGERLRTDYLEATHRPANGFDGMPKTGTPSSASVTDAQIDAAQRVADAFNAVRHDAMMILRGVVIEEITLTSVAVSLGYSNPKEAMGALKISLNQLAEFYNI